MELKKYNKDERNYEMEMLSYSMKLKNNMLIWLMFLLCNDKKSRNPLYDEFVYVPWRKIVHLIFQQLNTPADFETAMRW